MWGKKKVKYPQTNLWILKEREGGKEMKEERKREGGKQMKGERQRERELEEERE